MSVRALLCVFTKYILSYFKNNIKNDFLHTPKVCALNNS